MVVADDSSNSRPTPDPTILTTEQLLREIGGMRDLLEAEIARAEEVTIERFKSVATQLNLVERQRVEQKQDTKQAVDAALAAAKEAVKEQTTASQLSIDKSERATAEQLRQLTTTFETANAGLTTTVTDQKERLGTLELRLTSRLDVSQGRLSGGDDQRTERRSDLSSYVAVGGLLIGLVGAIVAIMAVILK